MVLTLQQLKLKEQGLGGSDGAATFWLSRWRTPLDIFFAKLNAEVSDQIDYSSTEWGTRLKPVIIQKFQHALGFEIIVDQYYHIDYYTFYKLWRN